MSQGLSLVTHYMFTDLLLENLKTSNLVHVITLGVVFGMLLCSITSSPFLHILRKEQTQKLKALVAKSAPLTEKLKILSNMNFSVGLIGFLVSVGCTIAFVDLAIVNRYGIEPFTW